MSKVSIIVPAYNSERTMEKCIESLIKQNYDDMEIIIVDDGSKDRTGEICKAYQKKENCIMYIRQDNQGVSDARNHGLRLATGKYVMFVDSDDTVTENYCKDMVEKIEQEDSELVICGYTEISVNQEKEMLPMHSDAKADSFDSIFKMTILNGMMNIPWNKIFIRDKISDCFNTDRRIGEDLEFNLKYLRNCTKISILNKPLYNYDITAVGSLTKNKRLADEAKVACCKMIEQFVTDKQVQFEEIESHYYAAFISSMKRNFLEYRNVKVFREDFQYLCKEYYSSIAKSKKSYSILHGFTRVCIRMRWSFSMYVLFCLKYRK